MLGEVRALWKPQDRCLGSGVEIIFVHLRLKQDKPQCTRVYSDSGLVVSLSCLENSVCVTDVSLREVGQL